MAEQVDLTTPEVKPSNTAYHLERLTLDIDDRRIYVQLKGVNGEAISKVYDSTTTPSGAALLSQINRGNFSINSLITAVYTRLKLDGVILGTISGTPT